VAEFVEGNARSKMALEAKPEAITEPAIGTTTTQANGLMNIMPGQN
jgi:hypothetical protein